MESLEEPSEEEFTLESLYQKLKELELLEEQVLTSVDYMFGRTFFNGLEVYSDGLNGQKIRHKSILDPEFFEEVRDRVVFFKNAVHNINQFRDILRDHINIYSRPHLRPLHLFDLPDEILIHICEYVQGREEHYLRFIPEINISVQEVKNMRLTCRRFCNASSHLLISCIYLDFDEASLHYLKEVSSHPVISKGVQYVRINLLYYDSVLEEDIDTFGDYHARRLLETTECIEDISNHHADFFSGTPKEVVDAAIRKGWNIGKAWLDAVGDFSDEEISDEDMGYRRSLLRAYRKYRRLYSKQEGLLLNRRFSRAVATAMSKMHNATRLDIFNSEYALRPKRRRRPDFITMVNDEESLISSTLFPITWEKGRRFELGEPPFDLLFEFPQAIKEAGIFLTALDIRVPPSDFCLLSSSPEDLEDITAATQKLKSFSYDPRVPYCSSLWATDESDEVEALGEFLCAHLSSPYLRDIQLSCDFLRADKVSLWFSLGSVLTSHRWPELESISLTGLAFHLSELEDFITRLDHPIIIWLKRVHLMSGTWARALDVLRGKVGAYPTLEDLSGGEFDNMSELEKKEIMSKNDSSWDMNKAELYILSTFKSPNPFRSSR